MGQRAFGGWEPERVERLISLQRRVARQRNLLTLTLPRLAGSARREELSAYGELLRQLYAAIRDETEAKVIVDASKWPQQALVMRQVDGIDLRVLHLVRDVRGVTYSWSKTDVPRLTRIGEGQLFPTNSPGKTAAWWSVLETEAAWLNAVTSRSTTIRYEDLVSDARGTLGGALAPLDLGWAADKLDHVQGDVVALGPSHGVSGNPSRFKTGDVTLRADDAWRTSLSRRDAMLVSALGLPALIGHGYLRRSRHLSASGRRQFGAQA